MPDNLFIGIDQSYTGLAMAIFNPRPDIPPVISRHDFSKAKSGDGITRLLAILETVEAFLERATGLGSIRHICIEGYSYGSKSGRELAGELGATIKYAIYYTAPGDCAYPTIVPPSSVKKYCTGNGAAPKSLMLKEVFRKWGVDLTNDNEADAYVLARMAMHADPNYLPLYRYEEEALSKITWHTERPVTQK